MSRANSLKKAVREIIEHTEKAVDDQNEQTSIRMPPPTILLEPSEDAVAQADGEQGAKVSGLQVGVWLTGKLAKNKIFLLVFSFFSSSF